MMTMYMSKRVRVTQVTNNYLLLFVQCFGPITAELFRCSMYHAVCRFYRMCSINEQYFYVCTMHLVYSFCFNQKCTLYFFFILTIFIL
jgi:hypothetical protein